MKERGSADRHAPDGLFETPADSLCFIAAVPVLVAAFVGSAQAVLLQRTIALRLPHQAGDWEIGAPEVTKTCHGQGGRHLHEPGGCAGRGITRDLVTVCSTAALTFSIPSPEFRSLPSVGTHVPHLMERRGGANQDTRVWSRTSRRDDLSPVRPRSSLGQGGIDEHDGPSGVRRR